MSGSKDCERCNQRRVSSGKRWCLSCCEAMAGEERLHQGLKENPPMENCTHILVFHKEGDVDIEDLYRANGMLCASRQKDIVRFGTDISTAQNRPFLNAEMASKFVRVMAEVDLLAQEQMLPLHKVIDSYVTLEGEPKAVIDERRAEDVHAGGLIMPVPRRLH
jgi:hypothetical protein